MVTTVIKKEKRGEYSFSLFHSNLSFFLGVVKMNNCIELHFQDLSTALVIATTGSNFSLYSKGNRSLLIRVIASTKEIIMGQTTIMHMDLLHHGGHTLYFQITHTWQRAL